MGDQDTKDRVSKKRKRNFYAKLLRDTGDNKGAFAIKVVDSKKTDYKREKINIRDIEEDEEENG